MATVQDLVAQSLREILVLAAGETMTAADGADGLATLNRMVNAWKAETVYIYANTGTDFTIIPNQQEYTVGAGGDANVLRPVHVDAITMRDAVITPPYEIPLRLMTDMDWADLRIKTQVAYRPSAAYYNLTYPLASIKLWPIPTSATLTGVIYALQAVDEFPLLATVVSLPPGYERMIVKNLAVELAPQYGAPVSPQLEKQAAESMAVVMRANHRLVEMKFDPGAGGTRRIYDIYSDTP